MLCKFDKGQKVKYFNLKGEDIEAVVETYQLITNIICGKKYTSLVVKLDNGELIHDRFLNAI